MKKMISAVLLLVFLFQLSDISYALSPILENDGIYGISSSCISNIRTESGVTSKQSVVRIQETPCFEDAAQFTVTCGNVVNGKRYIVYLLSEEAVPSKKNLYYVNYTIADSDMAVFNVFPKDLEAGTYYLYVVGEGRPFSCNDPLASLCCYKAPRIDIRINLNGQASDQMSLLLNRDGEDVKELSLLPNESSVMIEDIKCGDYEISAPGFVKWKKHISPDDASNHINLVRTGDIDGNGADVQNSTYGVLDMQCLYEFLSTKSPKGALSNDVAYFSLVADVNGDQSVDILDYQSLYEIVTGR